MNVLRLPAMLMLCLLTIQACKKGDDTEVPDPNPCEQIVAIDSLIAEEYANNVLRYTMSFQTSEVVDAYINYWPISETIKKRSVTSAGTTNHSIRLINMTAETAYNYEIISMLNGCSYVSDIYSFNTGALPESLPDLILNNTSLDFEGYIMVGTYLPGVVFALNDNAEYVWYEFHNSTVLVSTITPNQSVVNLLGAQDYIEQNFYGDTIRSYEYLEDYNDILHHEIFINDNNETLSLIKDVRLYDLTTVGGGNSENVSSDGIIIFNKDGTERWRWSLFDVANPLDDPFIASTANDWSHGNALSYDKDGNFLISLRNFNQIWKINSTDGSLMWKLGQNGDFQMDVDDYFLQQHAVHLTPDGDMMLYDNGDGNNPRSRALVFEIDETNMTASTKLKIQLPADYYSARQSNCSMIDDDKVLFGNSLQNAVIITDLNGNFLWDIETSGTTFYRAYYLEEF